jgi:hypothetical protein
MSNLEAIFNNSLEKELSNQDKFNNERIERWNKDLKACNELFDQLSFLNQHGKIIEKVCCTPYNKDDAQRGFYPYLRVPSQLAIIHPIHDDKEFVMGCSGGRLDGKFSLESFVKKVATIFKRN